MTTKLTLAFALTVAIVHAQGGRAGGPGMSMIRLSPILNSVDADQDGVLSAAEIANAAPQLRKLDKNNDGKLTADETALQFPGGPGGRGGREEEEPPAPAPSADELTTTLMAFDANKNGKLEKNEVPERMQGMFDRGDTNHDSVLTRDEIAKLAEANRQQGGGGGRGPGEGRGGRGRGPGMMDAAFNALDTDHNNEISASEINNAPASLKTLDTNGDGRITDDEVMPAFGGRGFGRGPGGPARPE